MFVAVVMSLCVAIDSILDCAGNIIVWEDTLYPTTTKFQRILAVQNDFCSLFLWRYGRDAGVDDDCTCRESESLKTRQSDAVHSRK